MSPDRGTDCAEETMLYWFRRRLHSLIDGRRSSTYYCRAFP